MKSELVWHALSLQFDPVIADKLAEADIIVLIISSDFVASEYCCTIELPLAMNRHEQEATCVLPIIINEVHGWKKLPAGRPAADKPPIGKLKLGSLNALPAIARAIPKWKPQDTGWTDVARGIELAAEDLKQKRRKGS